MSNNVVYDAATNPIHSVTIYMSGQAQVTRHVNVHLMKGNNNIEIINLPKSLSNYSIRVDGIGDVVIRDIVYNPPSTNRTGFEPVSSSEIDALERERAQIDQELTIANTQSTVLQDYITSVSMRTTAKEELPDILRLFADEKREIVARCAELDERMRVIDDKIGQAEGEIRKKDTSDRASAFVVLWAKADGRADLSFSYIVNNVSWYPHYDLHVDVDKPDASKDGASCRARLHYRAFVSQSSGEDWSNVQVALSTASPQYSSYIPILTKKTLVNNEVLYPSIPCYAVAPVMPGVPYDPGWAECDTHYRSQSPSPFRSPIAVLPNPLMEISNRRSRSQTRGTRISHSRSRSSSRLRSESRSRSRSPSPTRIFVNLVDLSPITVPPPGFVQHSQANVTQHASGFNTIFSLDNPLTILSVAGNTVAHNVGIAVLELPHANLEWEAVLKGHVSVYLKCTMKNASDYTLMPGDASVFMNNSYVRTAFISHVNPQESFTCHLGVDPKVNITMHPQVEETNGPGTRIFSSKFIKTVKSRGVTVKNAGGVHIERLIIKDQVPVTNDRKFKIHIASPAGLPKIKERSLKEVSVDGNKVKARWSPLNKNEKSEYANEEGFIDWVCQVGAGETLDFKLSWEVKAPEKFAWNIVD